MAKAAQTTLIVDADEIEKLRAAGLIGPDDNEETLRSSDPDDIRVLTQLDLAGEVRWTVECLLPADKEGIVGEFGSSDLTAERVVGFGPGKYRIRGVKGSKFFGQRTIRVSPMSARPAASAAPASAATDVAGLLKLMNEQREQERRERSERSGKLLELAVPGMLSIVAAFVGKGGGNDSLVTALVNSLKPAPQMSLVEMTTALRNLKDLEGPKGDSTSQIDLVLKIMERAQEFGGKGEGSDNWIGLLRDVLKDLPVGDMVKGLTQPSQQTSSAGFAPVRPHIPPSAGTASSTTGAPSIAPGPVPPIQPVAAPSAAQAGAPQGEDMATRIQREQADKVLAWARADKRTELYAEVFLEELPEIVWSAVTPEQVYVALHNRDWWKHVQAFKPEFEPYYSWANQFRLDLIVQMRDQMEENGVPIPEIAPAAPPQIIEPDLSTGV